MSGVGDSLRSLHHCHNTICSYIPILIYVCSGIPTFPFFAVIDVGQKSHVWEGFLFYKNSQGRGQFMFVSVHTRISLFVSTTTQRSPDPPVFKWILHWMPLKSPWSWNCAVSLVNPSQVTSCIHGYFAHGHLCIMCTISERGWLNSFHSDPHRCHFSLSTLHPTMKAGKVLKMWYSCSPPKRCSAASPGQPSSR